jgi:hypothetical protein
MEASTQISKIILGGQAMCYRVGYLQAAPKKTMHEAMSLKSRWQ